MRTSTTLLTRRCRPRPAGFTLIEVLVALLVLAFGLLGAASLQTLSLRNTHSSDSRSLALYLAYDIIDRIHANRYSCVQGTAAPSSALGGFPGDCYDLVSSVGSYTFGTTAPTSTCFGTAANCSATSIATADLWFWRQKVAAQLPGGDAVVCNDNTPGDGKPFWANGGLNTAAAYGCDGASVAATACASCGASAPVLTVKIWWDDRLLNNQAGTRTDASDTASTATYRRLYLNFQP